MPRAPKKCAKDGCETRGTTRYCPGHAIHWAKGASRTGTAEHKAWRKTVLNRDHWRCQIRGVSCLGKATQADHIVNVKAGGAEFDPANGQGVCEPCHQTKSLREAAEGRRANT